MNLSATKQTESVLNNNKYNIICCVDKNRIVLLMFGSTSVISTSQRVS